MARDQQQMSNDAQQSIDQGQNPFNDTRKVAHPPPRLINEVQRLLAELLGTFALTMVRLVQPFIMLRLG
jgi:hypothetical protein